MQLFRKYTEICEERKMNEQNTTGKTLKIPAWVPLVAAAVGIIAIGNFAVGVISLGLISLGVFSLGMIAFGGLALGMVSIGWLAVGASAMGVYDHGQQAQIAHFIRVVGYLLFYLILL